MKLGLRLQILLLLGALLLLAFLPLFFAVATYTSVSLRRVQVAHARALGRAIAGQVVEARAHRGLSELALLVARTAESAEVLGIVMYDPGGRVVVRAGEPDALAALLPLFDAREATVNEVKGSQGRALAVVVPDARGTVATLVRSESTGSAPLIRLLALYTGLVALVLLVMSYFALTRLIVRPLDALSRAAERVASGARRLEVPRSGVRELAELGNSLKTMTERLLAEEESLRKKIAEVERTTRSLEETQQRLVRSERLASVGRLSAGLAHEIGNPIAAIIGLLDLLLAGGLEPHEERDFLSRMRRETERINRILRDLLQFARPSASDAAASVPGDVSAAVHDTVALVAPQRVARQVEIITQIAPQLPLVALSHEHLVQVLLNLLLNAADACEAGGIIRVHAERVEASLRLSVMDTGPGVDPAIQARLFEPFVTTKETGKGTGLGLAVCRGLVEAAGGTIQLQPTHGRGACFVIDLPPADH
ncbi:MAG TPA: ATP-binding protein [Polyangiaceae bacterium]